MIVRLSLTQCCIGHKCHCSTCDCQRFKRGPAGVAATTYADVDTQRDAQQALVQPCSLQGVSAAAGSAPAACMLQASHLCLALHADRTLQQHSGLFTAGLHPELICFAWHKCYCSELNDEHTVAAVASAAAFASAAALCLCCLLCRHLRCPMSSETSPTTSTLLLLLLPCLQRTCVPEKAHVI
jgi:hypothetical protein